MADFHVFKGPEELSQAAARLFIDCARKAIDLRGRFIVALSGGSTPKRLFHILAEDRNCKAMPWEKMLIFWGDERAVGPDHEWSNYKLAQNHLLAHVPVHEKNVFRIKGELGAKLAAEDMRQNMINIFGDQGVPRFDLALQGMGTDGHTASLFPDTDALTATDWVVSVIAPPANPNVDRVTITLPVLNAARLSLFLVAGKGKRQIISEIRNDPTAPWRYPAACVKAEKTIWYVDDDAFDSTLADK